MMVVLPMVADFSADLKGSFFVPFISLILSPENSMISVFLDSPISHQKRESRLHLGSPFLYHRLFFPELTTAENPPANPGDTEMWVQSLSREDPLQKKKATHSSILAWEIPLTEELGRL